MAKTEKVTCPTCNGSGVDPARSYTEHPPCPTCGGSGEITEAKAQGIADSPAAPPPEPTPAKEPDGDDRK